MCVCIYHGQHDLCLVQDRLGEHGQVDTLGNLYCSSIQVSDNNIQLVNKTEHVNLKVEATPQCVSKFNTNEWIWARGNTDMWRVINQLQHSKAQTLPVNTHAWDIFTHQLLNFILELGVNADDEGGGRAQHLKQPWRQDWDVWVTTCLRRNGQ